MNGYISDRGAQVLLNMPVELAEALTNRAQEIGLSRSELLRRLAASFVGIELGTELETEDDL